MATPVPPERWTLSRDQAAAGGYSVFYDCPACGAPCRAAAEAVSAGVAAHVCACQHADRRERRVRFVGWPTEILPGLFP